MTGQYRDFDGTARVFRANICSAPAAMICAVLPARPPHFDRDQVRADGINFQKLKLYNLASTFDWDLGSGDLDLSHLMVARQSIASRGDIDGGFGAAFLPVPAPASFRFPAQFAG